MCFIFNPQSPLQRDDNISDITYMDSSAVILHSSIILLIQEYPKDRHAIYYDDKSESNTVLSLWLLKTLNDNELQILCD